MLSGIKVGKKKTISEASNIPDPTVDRTRPDATSSRNATVAEQIRQSLLNPQKQPPTSTPKSESEFDARIVQEGTRAKHTNNHHTPGVPTHYDHSSTWMIPPPCNPGNESEMSILDLLKQEKMTTSRQEERSIYQQQKKRKNYDDDDDDDTFQTHLYSTNHLRDGDPSRTTSHTNTQSSKFKPANRSDPQNSNNNHRNRPVVDTPCFWWIQSSNFAAHRLLLPNHPSDTLERIVLVMAPPSQSIVFGEHFYIVPIEYTASYSTCTDPHTWTEIRSVQSKLRSMASTQQKGVLFFETNFGSGSSVWQARLEAVWVPLDLYDDAPLYFRSALMEQAEEESSKPNIIHINTLAKPLYHTIPKNFPYFYIEYDDATRRRCDSKPDTNTTLPPHNADVLLMESPQRFPKTFGADTIASMMDLEPMRVRHRHRNMSHADERQVVTQWLQRWNDVR